MKFFKAHDFIHSSNAPLLSSEAADLANAKLEREGIKVYSDSKDELTWKAINEIGATHKALLINIEPVEQCAHPAENVFVDKSVYGFYNLKFIPLICTCGAKVRAKTYEVIE